MTPLVEPLSLDEAYLDVTENAWGEPLGLNVAQRLKADIRDATGLTASAGVAPNKFLAKIASGWKKPDGLTVIAPERVEQFLQKLPVDALWGVGPVTAQQLRARGIERLVRRAHDRPGDAARGRRQPAPTGCGSSPTASTTDRSCRTAIGEIVGQREHVPRGPDRPGARSAREIDEMARERRGLARTAGPLTCRTVTIKVRYSDFTTITRSHSKTPPTRDADDIAARAVALLDRTEAGQPAGAASRRQRAQPG